MTSVKGHIWPISADFLEREHVTAKSGWRLEDWSSRSSPTWPTQEGERAEPGSISRCSNPCPLGMPAQGWSLPTLFAQPSHQKARAHRLPVIDSPLARGRHAVADTRIRA